MKILAIGAHPDDIEIFMFGILCVLKKEVMKFLPLLLQMVLKVVKIDLIN